ncbi:MAG: DUF58 domain-containing protein [Firmicutes bacterium]|nr:DUF58 domain-containing protein [Bacillota bacterium]
MITVLKSIRDIKHITANRIMYTVLLAAVCIFAWSSGERLAYISAAVLIIVPLVSYVITFFMLRVLRVRQDVPATIVKMQEGAITLRLHNPSALPFAKLECIFFGNKYAIETQHDHTIQIDSFKSVEEKIPFRVLFRGEYEIGLQYVIATDFVGLFRIRRKYSKNVKILALPRIIEFSNIPLAIDLVAEASSRFDIRDEDYSIISDVRPYVPTDSIKRVHWKLTAKRNEWMVKMFQSNAQNHVSIIMDNLRMPVPEEEMYPLEDSIVENALGLARFCLNRGMPVDFMVTDGNQTHAQTGAAFDTIYHMAGDVVFENAPLLSPVSILAQVLNDASGNVNTIIFTATLTSQLYERVINAVDRGNYTAVIYFAMEKPNREYEIIFSLLEEGGFPCFKIWAATHQEETEPGFTPCTAAGFH